MLEWLARGTGRPRLWWERRRARRQDRHDFYGCWSGTPVGDTMSPVSEVDMVIAREYIKTDNGRSGEVEVGK